MDHPDASLISGAIHVISTERAALANLENVYRTDQLAQDSLARSVNRIAHSVRTGGKLVVCGVGKSGKIGKKIEATMNSFGIFSAFLHPTEALHGDLGMVRPNDTLLLISFSGRTSELLLLLQHIPPSVSVIALTAHSHPSTCPLLSYQPPDLGILLPAPIHEAEESSFGVCAPTSSTTVALALGDALAISAARKLHTYPGRGPAEVFKSYHPGGAIGAGVAAAASASAMSTPNSMLSSSSSSSSSSGSFFSSPSSADSLAMLDCRVGFSQQQQQQQQQQSQPNTFSSPSSTTITPESHHEDPKDTNNNNNNQPITKFPTFTPLSQIPSLPLPSPTHPLRLLDILLTAIHHPTANSWVRISDSHIVPPRRVRSLARNPRRQNHYANYKDLACGGVGAVVGVGDGICLTCQDDQRDDQRDGDRDGDQDRDLDSNSESDSTRERRDRPVVVDKRDWVVVSSECTVEDARRLLRMIFGRGLGLGGAEEGLGGVVAVMSSRDKEMRDMNASESALDVDLGSCLGVLEVADLV